MTTTRLAAKARVTGKIELTDWLLVSFCALILFFLTVPILIVLPLSFNSELFLSYPMAGLSLRWYTDFFTNIAWQRATLNSLIVASATMVLATALGVPAALGLSRARFRFKPFLVAFLISPLVVPTIITALGIYFLFAKIGLTNSLWGLIIGHTVLATPFVVIIMTATLRGFDLNLARAAVGLGASPTLAFFTVSLPVVMPGLVSSMVFAFVTSFDEAVLVLFIAGVEQHTLTREMWKGVREKISPTILAAATVMVLVSIVILTALELLRRRRDRLRGVRS